MAVDRGPSPGNGEHNLTARTWQGLRWAYIGTASSAVMQLVYAGIMGRLLDPAAFGLVAMAGVTLRLGQYFAQMGVGQALIQRPHLTAEEVRAGFTSNVLLGTLFTVVFAAAAPLAVWIFDNEDVVSILRLLSLSFLLQGLTNTAAALLRRELRFRTLAIIDVSAAVFGYFLVGVPLALMGAGAYSLVGAMLSQVGVTGALCFVGRRHQLAPTFRWSAYRDLYGFGARVSVISFLEFLTSFLDTFVIGRFAAATALGQYNRAFVIVNVPFQQVGVSLTKVLFPSFSRVQGELARLLGAYVSAVGVMGAVFIPVAVGIGLAAPEVVGVVLGPQWGPAQRILPILALAATVNLMTHLAAVMCEAAAALNQKLVVQALTLVTFTVLLALAIGGPLEGYAGAVLVGELLRHIYYQVLLRRVFQLQMRTLLPRYGGAVVAACIVGGAVWGARMVVLPASPALVIVLAAEVLAGAVGLLVALRLWPLRAVRLDLIARLRQAEIVRDERGVKQMGLRLLLGRDVRQ